MFWWWLGGALLYPFDWFIWLWPYPLFIGWLYDWLWLWFWFWLCGGAAHGSLLGGAKLPLGGLAHGSTKVLWAGLEF